MDFNLQEKSALYSVLCGTPVLVKTFTSELITLSVEASNLFAIWDMEF